MSSRPRGGLVIPGLRAGDTPAPTTTTHHTAGDVAGGAATPPARAHRHCRRCCVIAGYADFGAVGV